MTLEEYLAEHPKKYLIFDLDLTLARIEVDWSGVFQNLFSTVQEIDPSLALRVPESSQEYFSLLNQAAQRGETAKQRLNIAVEKYEKDYGHGHTPNPILISFIHSHKDKYSFAIWSSNSSRVVHEFLQKEHLIDVFKWVIAMEDVAFTKPNPDGFHKIYDRNNSKDDYLMIGDSSSDENATKTAGIDFFKIDYFS
jgi:phosphoglycolate phosphatase-like HAD superfamily hydrolase